MKKIIYITLLILIVLSIFVFSSLKCQNFSPVCDWWQSLVFCYVENSEHAQEPLELGSVFIPPVCDRWFLTKESFEQKRERVLGELSLSIKEAAAQGKYNCCIEPPCTMCYLGSWIWDDGVCRCDDMIANGEFDKVCPECRKGIEEGLCKSSVDACDPDNGEIFKSLK